MYILQDPIYVKIKTKQKSSVKFLWNSIKEKRFLLSLCKERNALEASDNMHRPWFQGYIHFVKVDQFIHEWSGAHCCMSASFNFTKFTWKRWVENGFNFFLTLLNLGQPRTYIIMWKHKDSQNQDRLMQRSATIHNAKNLSFIYQVFLSKKKKNFFWCQANIKK